MRDTFIKLLGGYTKKEYNKRHNELDNIEKEEFEVNQEIYFYYVSRIDYQSSCYHKGIIIEIKTINSCDSRYKEYKIECTDSCRFSRTFIIDEKMISKTKVGLRNKIVNSDEYTFLTFLSHEDIEERLR